MSECDIPSSQITGDLPFDKRLTLFIDAIRWDTMSLVRPDKSKVPSSLDNVSCALGTLKSLADATLQLAERERLWAEKGTVVVEIEKIKAETEKIRAETERIKAQKM